MNPFILPPFTEIAELRQLCGPPFWWSSRVWYVHERCPSTGSGMHARGRPTSGSKGIPSAPGKVPK